MHITPTPFRNLRKPSVITEQEPGITNLTHTQSHTWAPTGRARKRARALKKKERDYPTAPAASARALARAQPLRLPIQFKTLRPRAFFFSLLLLLFVPPPL